MAGKITVFLFVFCIAFFGGLQAESVELKLYDARYNKGLLSEELFNQAVSESILAQTSDKFSALFAIAVDSKIPTAQLKTFISKYEATNANKSVTSDIVDCQIASAKAYQSIKELGAATALYKIAVLYVSDLPTSDIKDRYLSDCIVGIISSNGKFNEEAWEAISNPSIKINVLAQTNPSANLIAECPSSNLKKESIRTLALAWARSNSADKALVTLKLLPNRSDQLWALSKLLSHSTIPSESLTQLQAELEKAAVDTSDRKANVIAQAISVSIFNRHKQPISASLMATAVAGSIGDNQFSLEDKIKISLMVAPECITLNRGDLILRFYTEILKSESTDHNLVTVGIRELNSKLVQKYIEMKDRKNARNIASEFSSIGLDSSANTALFWDAIAENNKTMAFKFAQAEADPFLKNCRYLDLVHTFGESNEFKMLLSLNSSQ